MTAPDIQARLVEGGNRELDAEIAVLLDGFHTLPPRYHGDEIGYGYTDEDGANVRPGHGGKQLVRHYTTSVDAALALAERVLDSTEALGILHAVIDHVGSNGLPSSQIAPLFCAAIVKAKALQDGRDG